MSNGLKLPPVKAEKDRILGYTVTITRYEKGRGPMNKMVRLDAAAVTTLTRGKQVKLMLEDADFIKAEITSPIAEAMGL